MIDAPSLPDRRDTGNWLDRRATDTASFRDRFAGTIQDVCAGLAIVAFIIGGTWFLSGCITHPDMSRSEAITISAIVAGDAE